MVHHNDNEVSPCATVSQSIMQNPTDQVEAPIPTASIPTEAVTNGPCRSGMLRRKAAKRTEPWYLVPPQPRNLAAPLFPPPPPQLQGEHIRTKKKPRLETQGEHIRAKEKPRLEKPLPTVVSSLVESATKTASSDGAFAPPRIDVDDTNTDPVTIGATASWTPEEDEELTSAVANSCKTKWGKKEYLIDWAAVATLIPGRTQVQCQKRWDDTLKLSIAGTAKRAVMWTEEEDIKLKHSVQMHGGKSWFAISALVPGRTKMQCMRRWNCCLKPNMDRATRRSGAWTEDEDLTLRHAVEKQDGKDSKDWVAIAALVPGRTKKQCWSRWDHILDPNIDRVTGSSGTWTAVEDTTLKDSVEKHGGKDWAAITALVPGRTKIQCTSRWHDFLKHSIVVAPGRTGKWTEDEDAKLKDSVEKHGGKDWVLIATLVSSRTKKQCRNRWQNCLKPSIDRASGYSGVWTEDEDTKLKASVHTHGGKDWVAIAELLPGRTKKQCWSRWENSLRPSIDHRTTGYTGVWTEDEDDKLKDWAAITALVPNLTKKAESEQMAKFLAGSQHP